MPPRVTVIIPTYNWSSVLPFSIGSVLRQSFSDFELLVIGDGCTDDSESVVTAIDDPRVRWINLPAPTGHQSGPNNEGLRQARGELIAYLGHDDLWLPHHLTALVAALDRGGDIAHAIMAWIRPDGSSVPLVYLPEYFGEWTPPSCIVHRRSVTETIGGWRHYREAGDAPEVELLDRAKAAGFAFTFVPRLTGIKFPASERKDVYKTKPSREQQEWYERIGSEPDFEVIQLSRWIADPRWPLRMRYTRLARLFVQQTARRIRGRMSFKRGGIEAIRRFKGL